MIVALIRGHYTKVSYHSMASLLMCVITDCQNNLTNRSTDGMTTLPSNHVSKPQLGAEQLQQGNGYGLYYNV